MPKGLLEKRNHIALLVDYPGEDIGRWNELRVQRITHGQWGEGTIQRYDDEAVVVLFDDVGYRTLAVDVVVERDLLESVG